MRTPVRDSDGTVYAGYAARVLAWLLFLRPVTWITNCRDRVWFARLHAIFGEAHPPLTLRQILGVVRSGESSTTPLSLSPSGQCNLAPTPESTYPEVPESRSRTALAEAQSAKSLGQKETSA